MKKFFVFVTVMMVILSLTACVSEDNYNASVKELEEYKAQLSKYESVISLLENEDFDGAVRRIEEMRPDPPTQPITSIEIDTNNWDEYFEIREYYELWKNDLNDYTNVYSCVGVFLKEEYLNRLIPENSENESKVSFEVEYFNAYKKVTLDKQTGEFSFDDKEYKNDSKNTSAVLTTYDGRNKEPDQNTEYKLTSPEGKFLALLVNKSGKFTGTYEEQGHIENPRILRAKGVIYLYK